MKKRERHRERRNLGKIKEIVDSKLECLDHRRLSQIEINCPLRVEGQWCFDFMIPNSITPSYLCKINFMVFFLKKPKLENFHEYRTLFLGFVKKKGFVFRFKIMDCFLG